MKTFNNQSEVMLSAINDTEFEVKVWLNGGSSITLCTVLQQDVYDMGSVEEYKTYYLRNIDQGNVLTEEQKLEKYNENWNSLSDFIKVEAIEDSGRWKYIREMETKIDNGISQVLQNVC